MSDARARPHGDPAAPNRAIADAIEAKHAQAVNALQEKHRAIDVAFYTTYKSRPVTFIDLGDGYDRGNNSDCMIAYFKAMLAVRYK